MVKHTQTIRPQQLTNCLSVFDHYVWLALKNDLKMDSWLHPQKTHGHLSRRFKEIFFAAATAEGLESLKCSSE